MAPRKRCPVCRSKQWHKEPSSGLIACSEGHILQNYRNETNEVQPGEVGPHAVRKRTFKSNREKAAPKGVDERLYHGNRGRYFYFQCLQLILRHQIAVLLERWALPAEFEVVCRDLWALNLSLLRDPPPPEPYLASQDADADLPASASPPKREAALGFDEDPKQPPSSDDDAEDEETEEAENDPDLDELLAENSASDSSSSDEDDVDGNDKKKKPKSMPKSKKRLGLHNYERPASTLAVIVMACWTLRIPILYRDLTRLIESYELPHLEAIRILPQSMIVHLTKHNIQALSPRTTPSAQVLHHLASTLAGRIYATFGVATPEANAAPILWRVVTQCLGGSPTLYKLTKRLSNVLGLPLTLHHSLAPPLQRVKQRDPHRHKNDNVAPEVAFVATGIIVLKMVYGLDGKERLPADEEDPACDMPRIDEYLGLLRRLEDEDGLIQFDSRTAMAIEDLSEDTVDEYLAFCERALVGPGNDVLDRYFPFPEMDETAKGASAAEGITFGLRPTRVQDAEEEAVLRPGARYTHGDGGEMPDAYAAVVGRAAGWVGVREEYLRGVVLSYERRIRGRGKAREWKNIL
ncbi:hypothetical protein C8F04DRAFT_1058314 [Mycena alexandri]|uniref:RRN7-type domain-containing protein n=1 Tax=Mycena alexandri TaxID=1745969 RepID=A0AAD6TJ41_9AGAR|nr:hypothetical protein C8F04DRAFT_1058314 [Mycena alexandri]